MLRTDRCSLILIAVFPLTVAGAPAQRLLERDDIELRGTTRIVTFGTRKSPPPGTAHSNRTVATRRCLVNELLQSEPIPHTYSGSLRHRQQFDRNRWLVVDGPVPLPPRGGSTSVKGRTCCSIWLSFLPEHLLSLIPDRGSGTSQ